MRGLGSDNERVISSTNWQARNLRREKRCDEIKSKTPERGIERRVKLT